MVGIGFFAPFPLALMVPFMAGQSLAMGEAFGKGFQYGKRKISSMSNEEFNALNFQQLSESLATDYRVMIPSLVESIKASDRLQDAVFKALADVIKDIPSQILEFFGTSVPGTTDNGHHTTLTEEIDTSIDKTGSTGIGGGAWLTLGINSLLDFWHWLGVDNEEFKKIYHSSVQTVFNQRDAQKALDLKREIITDGAYQRFLNRQTETVTGTFSSTAKDANLATQKLLKKTLSDLNNQISNIKKTLSDLRSSHARAKSELNARVVEQRIYGVTTQRKNAIASLEKSIQSFLLRIGQNNQEHHRLIALFKTTDILLKKTQDRFKSL